MSIMFCPNCGSKDISIHISSKYACKSCGYCGEYVVEKEE